MAPTRHEQRGPAGAASSTHYLGTSTAMAVLARGGNAFDAVVAAGFVLQVVEPHLCGPGGEVPAVFVTAGDPAPRVLCGQGVAPAAATVGRLRDGYGLDLVPGTGLLAATVPGAWDGWLVLLRDHGTLTLAEALEPALRYAAGGFPLVPRIAPTIATVAGHFRDHWPSSAETWLVDGRPPARTHRLPALAATWRRLLAAATGPSREAQIDAARDAWYRGFVAEEIAAFCATPVRDGSGRDHPGLLTADDLARWSATYEDAPVTDVGGGWAVAKAGPWSQGPVLPQALQLVEDPRYVDGVATAGTVHRAAEAAKLAFADREAWYGDSADVPIRALLSPAYAAERRTLIVRTRPPSRCLIVFRFDCTRTTAGAATAPDTEASAIHRSRPTTNTPMMLRPATMGARLLRRSATGPAWATTACSDAGTSDRGRRGKGMGALLTRPPPVPARRTVCQSAPSPPAAVRTSRPARRA